MKFKKYILFIFISFILSCESTDKTIIPIDYSLGLPVVKVVINGKVAHMVFDSGGGMTIIDSRKLSKFGLFSETRNINITGYGGDRSVDTVTGAATIELNGIISREGIYTSDLSNLTREVNVDGILGLPHIRDFQLIVNFSKGQIYQSPAYIVTENK